MKQQDTPQWDKEGGAAFPIPASELSGSYEPEPGMSLRDYFAAKAMQGCLAYSHVCPSTGNWQENGSHSDLAKYVYLIADAMLAERDKPTS